MLSGLFLLQKGTRPFLLIIGGMNCLQITILGTDVGGFTILVVFVLSGEQNKTGGLPPEDRPA